MNCFIPYVGRRTGFEVGRGLAVDSMYCAAYDLAYDAIMMLRRDSEIAGGHHKGLADRI